MRRNRRWAFILGWWAVSSSGKKTEAWGLFSPGAAFFRRIAFASLLVLASLGSFLVTRENAQSGVDGAAIMAQHDLSGTGAEGVDRDRILVTLASYRE